MSNFLVHIEPIEATPKGLLVKVHVGVFLHTLAHIAAMK